MNCPACKEAMIVLEHDKIEIDHCVACGGIWLDRGELELLTGNSECPKGDSPLSEKAEKGTVPFPQRKCPICLKKMESVLCGNVQIDRCRKGDGIWFDLGELEQILKSCNFGENSKVFNWLKNIFSKAS